ncbi:MAG TPA: hypothetical protein EYG57_04760 [Planctomycetes bacterium]|nr:hypothetical protein [Planctomycetota bacterium]
MRHVLCWAAAWTAGVRRSLVEVDMRPVRINDVGLAACDVENPCAREEGFHFSWVEAAFAEWRLNVRVKLLELMAFPEAPPQPDPKKLCSKSREGYTLEKWEIYPAPYKAVERLVCCHTLSHSAPQLAWLLPQATSGFEWYWQPSVPFLLLRSSPASHAMAATMSCPLSALYSGGALHLCRLHSRGHQHRLRPNMVLPQGPSARLLWLVARAGVGRLIWLFDVYRFVRGGIGKTSHWVGK